MPRRFDEFCRRLARLKVDRAKPPPKPYKPLLMIAVIILIAKRKITSRNVLLDSGLRSAFEQLLRAGHPNWPYRADIRYPFRHLENDGIWRLVPFDAVAEQYQSARAVGARARDLLKHVACAEMDVEVFERLAVDGQARLRTISILLEEYELPAETARFVLTVLGGTSTSTPEASDETVVIAPDWNEKAVEEALTRRWSGTPFAKMGVALSTLSAGGLPARQVLTSANAIDILGFREGGPEWWVFELKRGRPSDKVVGQISRYLGWISSDPVALAAAPSAVGVILAQDSDAKLEYAVAANDRLSLWLYDNELRFQRVST